MMDASPAQAPQIPKVIVLATPTLIPDILAQSMFAPMKLILFPNLVNASPACMIAARAKKQIMGANPSPMLW
jgi:sensor histidine kinase regulating citrate/malate metabolism